MLITTAQFAVLFCILTTGAFFWRGWQRRTTDGIWQRRYALLSFSAGIVLLAIAAAPPVLAWMKSYFFARAAQHLLLTAIIPALLLIPDPLPILLAGLPDSVTYRMRRLSVPRWARRAAVATTNPWVVWFLFVSTFWFWYDVTVLEATTRSSVLQFLESATLLSVSLLYWWHIANAWPRLHAPMPPLMHAIYPLAGVLPVKLVGIVLLFGAGNVYGDETMLQIGRMVLSDEALGAIIIWIAGSAPYAWATVYLAARWIEPENTKPPLPGSLLTDPDTWTAPSLFDDR